MTDERIGDRLWEAIGALPEGDGGIVFRHYSLTRNEREQLGREVAAVARQRGIALAVGRDPDLAGRLGAGLTHNPDRSGNRPCSRSVHGELEARSARDSGAALAFVSPIYPTRSHPGVPSLGVAEATRLAGIVGCPAIALGGMDEERFAALSEHRFYGFGGIDCWLRT